MKRFRLSPLAKSDLAEIRHYIARDKPEAAARQIARFHERFHLLARYPDLGERRSEFRTGEYRSFSMGNDVIFYRQDPEGIEIARVVSGHRDFDAMD